MKTDEKLVITIETRAQEGFKSAINIEHVANQKLSCQNNIEQVQNYGCLDTSVAFYCLEGQKQ